MPRTLFECARQPLALWSRKTLPTLKQRLPRHTIRHRSSKAATQTETIYNEDLGVINSFIPPKGGILDLLTSPKLLVKTLYHRIVVNNKELRSFRKRIRPDSLSVPMLVSG